MWGDWDPGQNENSVHNQCTFWDIYRLSTHTPAGVGRGKNGVGEVGLTSDGHTQGENKLPPSSEFISNFTAGILSITLGPSIVYTCVPTTPSHCH